MMCIVRQAVEKDVGELCAIDRIAQSDAGREDFIRNSVRAGNCFVLIAKPSNAIAGYCVLEYSFFSHGFISMLYVDVDHRRQNYATTLMNCMETTCRTKKVFSSTNLSNSPMQSLFAKLEYRMS